MRTQRCWKIPDVYTKIQYAGKFRRQQTSKMFSSPAQSEADIYSLMQLE